MNFIVFEENELEQLDKWNEDTKLKIIPRAVEVETSEDFGKHFAPARVTTGEYEEYWSEKLKFYPRKTVDPWSVFVSTIP